MKIGVVKEIKPDEYRVALTPAGARELVARGHDVVVERAPAWARAFADDAYVAAGAALARCRRRLGRRSELLLKVKEPLAGRVPAAAPGPRPLHLPAPRARARADAALIDSGRDLHRLRDGRDRRPPAAAARADERGRRPARAADGRARAREVRTAAAAMLLGGVAGVAAGRRSSCSAAGSSATTPR